MFASPASFHRNVFQNTEKYIVRLEEGRSDARNTMLLAKCLDIGNRFTVVLSRDSWIKVMFKLELKTTMEPIHPRRAVNVQSAMALQVIPGFIFLARCVRLSNFAGHGEVAEGDLK